MPAGMRAPRASWSAYGRRDRDHRSTDSAPRTPVRRFQLPALLALACLVIGVSVARQIGSTGSESSPPQAPLAQPNHSRAVEKFSTALEPSHCCSEEVSPNLRSFDTSSAPVARFVGETVCASCHAREAAAWKGSHHQLAMQPAIASDGPRQLRRRALRATTVSRRGSSAATESFSPAPTAPTARSTTTRSRTPSASRRCSNIWSRFPTGALQALAIAWDSRPRSRGGQRWFHLYPDEHIDQQDPLHWTGASENWNFMCADCHSTNVRKSYDGATGRYATSFAEISVSCEACHGPGSTHVAWARQEGDWQRASKDHGLLDRARRAPGRRLDARRDHRQAGAARRARRSQREIEMCARCHSRRGLLHEDQVHGQRLDDDYRVALLDDDLYYPDGQIKGEVYEYGSFVQSRMFAEGVTCSDCHDPHRPELRASGRQPLPAVPRRSDLLHRRSTTFTPRARRARAASAAICRRPPTWSSIRAAITACAFRGPIYR